MTDASITLSPAPSPASGRGALQPVARMQSGNTMSGFAP